MRRLLVFAALTALTLWTPSGLAQTSDDLTTLRKDIDALKEGQAAIQKELKEIKGLLQQGGRPSAAAPPKEAVVNVDGAPFKGQKNAKVTLVDFTDYQ
jgi:protein-disulfide isomerase